MLLGEFRHNLDAKNRIFIPAKYREELGDTFVISISYRENCLRVYSVEAWEGLIDQIRKMNGKEKDKIIRALTRRGVQAGADAQGRIILTPDQVAYAGIVKNACIVGCGDYAEIWSDENYNRMTEEESIDEIRDLLESFGL